MVLVDTSVWIRHLRKGDSLLAALLEEGEVLSHPFIVGELALGRLARREEILGLLANLPAAMRASDSEVLELIERRELAGSGIGWLDAHLLAAALLSRVSLWTLDRGLAKAAVDLGIGRAQRPDPT